MKKMFLKTKKHVIKKVQIMALAAALVCSTAGCGRSERALVRISRETSEEKAYTMTYVIKGNVTYQLEEELKLDNYVEIKYGLSSKLMDAMLLEDIKFEKLYVSVGDMVKEGDVLLTMSSDTLDSQIDQYIEQKEMAELEKRHYNNRTAIDSDEDNDMAIASCDEKINVAAGYISELEQKRENLTVKADTDGKIIEISDQAISGAISNTDGLLTLASGDDTYYLETEEITTLAVGDIVTASNKISSYDAVVINMEKSSAGTKIYFKLMGPTGAVENKEALAANLVKNASPSDAETSEKNLTIINGLMVPVAEETRENVLYVATEAVTEKDGHYYVFMLDENGARVAREIKVESVLGEYTIITDGVVEGDEVILE